MIRTILEVKTPTLHLRSCQQAHKHMRNCGRHHPVYALDNLGISKNETSRQQDCREEATILVPSFPAWRPLFCQLAFILLRLEHFFFWLKTNFDK